MATAYAFARSEKMSAHQKNPSASAAFSNYVLLVHYHTHKKKEHQAILMFFLTEMRQRPTLPYSVPYSTIGSMWLNFRVRYENGWIPHDIITAMVY